MQLKSRNLLQKSFLTLAHFISLQFLTKFPSGKLPPYLISWLSTIKAVRYAVHAYVGSVEIQIQMLKDWCTVYC